MQSRNSERRAWRYRPRVSAAWEWSEFYGRADYVRKCCEDSLRRLGVEHIDLTAAEVELSDADLSRIAEVAPRGAAAGERYADMSSVNR